MPSPRKRKGKRPKSARFAPAPPDDAGRDEDVLEDGADADVAPPEPPPETAKAPTTEKRTRRRDPLGMTKNQERYAAETHTQAILYTRGLPLGDPVARHKHARAASAASWVARSVSVDEDSDALVERDEEGRITATMAAARRHGINYFYQAIFGSPPEEEWDGRGGVAAQICERLFIPKNSARLVKKVRNSAPELHHPSTIIHK